MRVGIPTEVKNHEYRVGLTPTGVRALVDGRRRELAGGGRCPRVARVEPIELRGGDVLLSVPTPGDVDAITQACQDPDVAAWTTVPNPYARRDAEAFVRDVVGPGWTKGTSLTWAMREASDGRLLGMVGLGGIADGSAEIGYWVAPWARRRGVAGMAVRLVADHALDGLGLERVVWCAFVGNWPSRRIAWRTGFRMEGTIRAHLVQRGARRDGWVGTLLAGDPREPAEPWPAEAPAAR